MSDDYDVTIPGDEVAALCFALFAGELAARDVGEMDADAAAENLREALMDQMRDRDDDRLTAMTFKLKAYAYFDQMQSGGGGEMPSVEHAPLDADEVPEEHREALDRLAAGKIGFDDLSDDTREFITGVVSERTGAPEAAVREAIEAGAVMVEGIGAPPDEDDDRAYQ